MIFYKKSIKCLFFTNFRSFLAIMMQNCDNPRGSFLPVVLVMRTERKFKRAWTLKVKFLLIFSDVRLHLQCLISFVDPARCKLL